ncbi:hypothetical protein E3E35_07985 [Thermococcus sp. GR7]|uniref:hypothetical protein n=1 Tax=unclassified Thermococcus TaxID=2627626 RepID=UPI00142FE83F|nr:MULTISPECIES: hypothetical protein [unclassified Thermococcus]NJE47338.1 hypothetical protein [Thermococcus sp. GR7]NJE79449.1 hypothetical protein [Thermococcus sp. GR4]NJF23172.1 hypothetical protein [Thermococcus sp. GR5]
MERPKIWIHIDGRKVVTDHKVEAYTFGKLLIQIQKQINIIAEAQYGKKLKPKFRLFLSKIQEGSVEVALEFVGGTLPELQSKVAETHYEVYDAIQEEDEKALDEVIRESLKDPLYGYRLLTSVEEVIPSSDDYILGISKDFPKRKIRLGPKQRDFVHKMKLKYLQEATVEVVGIITDLHGKDPRYFIIDTTEGERIKVYITPELEPQVKEYYKAVPVKITGLLEKTAKKREIRELLNIIPQREVPLQRIGKFKLKQPIFVEFSYDMEDNLWILRNERLAIEGYGKTYKEAMKDLEDSLEGLIIGFLAFKDEDLAESARKIKEELSKYLDLNDLSHKYRPVVIKPLPVKEE